MFIVQLRLYMIEMLGQVSLVDKSLNNLDYTYRILYALFYL